MAIKKKVKGKHSSLSKRQKISYDSKEQGGGGSRIINWRDIDSEVKFFQPTVGRNSINIIPFEIKTKNHPLVKNGGMEIGELDYCLDLWTHRNVGPSESAVICLKKTFGKACPICEQADKLRKAGKEKEAAELRASRRVIYNVEDVRKAPGELQVFEVSHFLFEKELIDEARNEDSGEFVDFADPETGSIIKFRCSKQKSGGFEFNEFKSFTFEDREEPIDDDFVASAISFDQYLNIPTYDEVQAILYGDDEDEDDDEPPKKSKAVKKRSDDDEDDDDEPPKKSKPAKKKSEPDDDDEDEDEDDDEPPKKGKSPLKKSSEDDDEDDDDEEEEAPRIKKSNKGGNKIAPGPGKKKCPHGHTFGSDADEYEECEDCEVWTACLGK